MTYQWYKIWLVGNGGMTCFERHVYWYKTDDKEEMAYRIEQELGPYSGGIRSCHWEEIVPPIDVVQKHVDDLEAQKRSLDVKIKQLTKKFLTPNCKDF